MIYLKSGCEKVTCYCDRYSLSDQNLILSFIFEKYATPHFFFQCHFSLGLNDMFFRQKKYNELAVKKTKRLSNLYRTIAFKTGKVNSCKYLRKKC